MSDLNLPLGWASARLGDVCEPSQYGYTAKAGQSGNIHFLRTTDITSGPIDWNSVPFCDVDEETRKKYLLHDGDVVISRAGSVGFSCLIRQPRPSVFASYLIRFRPRINSDYFKFFLLTPNYWNAIGEQSLGIAVQNVNASNLSEIDVPVAPEAEQARIVEKLEELLSDLDAGVAELKAAQKKLGQYRQSLLKAAVEGALTAEWRAARKVGAGDTALETGAHLLERLLTERRARWGAKQLAKFAEQGKAPPKDWQKKYPEPLQPNTADLPDLPKGWVWASVDQCSMDESAITDGPFGSNLKSSHYQDTGPRVIRLQNIGDGVFLDARAHITESHYQELVKHAVEEGDLVVAMLGELLPRACIVPNGVSPAIVKADCARVRLNTKLLKSSVLMAQLNSKPVRDIVARFVKGIGRPRINLGHIRAIPVALCAIEEQIQIEASLADAQASIDEQQKAIEFALKQSAAQRKNLLKAAFSGQLVPQDPNDEPAHVLLELIRSERAQRDKQPKVRKTKPQKEIAAMVSKLIDVLADAGDWVPAQDVFRRCGVADGTQTDRIEELYAELRKLHLVEKRVQVKPETDAQGRKTGDLLKLVAN